MTQIIRCSMLPAWDDCARRTGGRQFTRLLSQHGHTLRSLLPSVGAAVGTAIHAGAELLLRARLAGDMDPRADDCYGCAEKIFAEQIARGAVWDATTPNIQIANSQLSRMLRAYLPVLADIRPVLVESELRGSLGDPWILSGHVDLLATGEHLDDLKTGVPPRTYMAQLGGYALVLEATGHKVRRATMTFLKRERLKNPQPLPVRTEYNLDDAKRVAWRAIQEIMRDVDEFARTGNPHALRANPMSLMCSDKYCPAWGTAFCTVHRKPQEQAHV